MKNAASKIDVYQIVTDKIVQALEQGVVPWQHPWTTGGRPRSMATGKTYRGINVLLLGLTSYSSPWWGTYNQIAAQGGQVRKGETGTIITLWKTFDKKPAADAKPGDKPQKGFMLRYFKVFNADQADGLPAKFLPSTEGVGNAEINDAQEVADKYFAAPGAPRLFHDVHGMAHWIPAVDEVHVPPIDEHVTSGAYYSTLFHEMTHTTGADDRLKRFEVKDYHGHARGVEELVAEIGAAILSAESGVEGVFDNSANYIGSWIKTIQEDNKIIVTAASKAFAAVDFIHAFTEDDEETDAA